MAQLNPAVTIPLVCFKKSPSFFSSIALINSSLALNASPWPS
jgi:hypothetical protein